MKFKKICLRLLSTAILCMSIYSLIQFLDTTKPILIRVISALGAMIIIFPTSEFINGMVEAFFTRKPKTDIVDNLEKHLPENYRID